MRTICFYFQVHQPYRLKRYRFFDIGNDHYYYDDYANKTIMRKVAEKCYLPTNQVLFDLIKQWNGRFKICYSISGTALDQFEAYAPDVLESFKRLAETGCVEFLAETYSHSLSALKSKEEFFAQVKDQSDKIERHFGQKPSVFRNTELIYSDWIGELVAEMGFKAMLTEGAKHILGWKSPNFVYYNSNQKELKVLLKNFKLSDDIAFRFSNRAWEEWPLTTEKYVSWLNSIPMKEDVVNLFMDYETFGEHQWADSGIFEFLKALPNAVFNFSDITFSTPSEVIKNHQPVAPIHVPYPISWADEERDLTAWLGNDLQEDAFNTLYSLQEMVYRVNDPQITRDWRYLQTSDHFYYMCTKFFSDGDVHKYFNPYNTPYDAFINYMNILSDFSNRLKDRLRHEKTEDIQIPENIDTEEAEQLIEKYEDAISKLKAKVLPMESSVKKTTAKKPVEKKAVVKKETKTAKSEVKEVKKTTSKPEKKADDKKTSATSKPATKATVSKTEKKTAVKKTTPEKKSAPAKSAIVKKSATKATVKKTETKSAPVKKSAAKSTVKAISKTTKPKASVAKKTTASKTTARKA